MLTFRSLCEHTFSFLLDEFLRVAFMRPSKFMFNYIRNFKDVFQVLNQFWIHWDFQLLYILVSNWCYQYCVLFYFVLFHYF